VRRLQDVHLFFIWLVVFSFLLVDNVPANAGESGPTKVETVDFIKSKVGAVVRQQEMASYDLSFNDCELTIGWKAYTNSEGRWVLRSEGQIFVPLGTLDPSRVRSFHQGAWNAVGFYATADKKTIRLVTSDRGTLGQAIGGAPMKKISDEMVHTSGIDFAGEREADQVARALGHLIILCGGRKELF
jgi:hypothetical protein